LRLPDAHGGHSRRHGSLPESCLTSEIPPAEDLSLRELEFIGFAPALTADLKYNESIANARRTFLSVPIIAAAVGDASADSLPVLASGDDMHHTPMEYASLLPHAFPFLFTRRKSLPAVTVAV
jgi:hypothetical protein